MHLKGTIAKAKANAAQAIPEMIEIATSKTFEDNKKNKHSRHASSGKMYLYDVLDIKKKRASPVRNNPYPVKTHFLYDAMVQ